MAWRVSEDRLGRDQTRDALTSTRVLSTASRFSLSIKDAQAAYNSILTGQVFQTLHTTPEAADSPGSIGVLPPSGM